MRFLQKGVIFWQTQVTMLLCLITCMCIILYNNELLSVLFLPAIAFLCSMILQCMINKETVSIDETGISCWKSDTLLWSHGWQDIKQLEIISLYHSPAIAIILYGDCSVNQHIPKTVEYYYQLGYTAKKATNMYCKCPIVKKSIYED